MSDELGNEDTINCEKLKEVSGDTPMAFRALYSEQKRNFNHCCTLKMNTNCIPKFNAMDTATMNRICAIPCERQQKENQNQNLTAVDCMGYRYRKQLQRDPEKATKLLGQPGLDALFTIL